MGIPQYTLAWDSYQKNLCNGLSTLQEKGEFVDMTLAADGYFVKVHKMVMSLVSPYIKDLISTADCPHPVIFLNNISYRTLCLILEYIYTGQVSVNKECLSDLIQAGKALYIKGLIDMVESCYSHIADNDLATIECNDIIDSTSHAEEDSQDGTQDAEPIFCETRGVFTTKVSSDVKKSKAPKPISRRPPLKRTQKSSGNDSQIQYTMSNQGNLQIMLNRYVYNMRYLYRNSNRRMWRCIYYPKQQRCPAYVITEGNEIIDRCCIHNHAYHDKNIIRKVREGKVFSLLKDAELQMEIQKRTRAAEDSLDT